MNYARDNNGSLEYPQDDDFAGVSNWRTNDQALRRRKFLPLRGLAEHREGYVATSPKSWHVVAQSSRRFDVIVDTSYIQIDEWDYVPAPDPLL